MSRFIMPRQGAKGQNLSPHDGAKLYFKIIGQGIGGTDKSIYTDEALSVASTNPAVADATGLFGELWLNGDYDVFLRDKNDVLLWGPETIRSLSSSIDINTTKAYLTLDEMVADGKNLNVGNVAYISERAAGNGGGAHWKAIASTTNNGFDIVDVPLNATISLELIKQYKNQDPKQWGAISGDVTDVTSIFQAIYDKGFQVILDYNDAFSVTTINMPVDSSMSSMFHTDQNVPIINGLNSNANILSYADGTGCEIVGVGFNYGTTTGSGWAVSMLNPVRATIRDCSVFTAPNGFDLFGVISPATSPGNNRWKDNYFANVGTGTAIHLLRTHNDLISGNRTDLCGKGLHMEHSCFENIVTKNEFSHCSVYALETDGNSVGHLIENNIYALNAVDLQLSGRSYNIRGNVFKQTEDNSIYLNIFRDSTISGNTFRGVATTADGTNRFSAIWGNNAIDRVNITDNIFGSELTAVARYCALLRFSQECKVINNQMGNGYVTGGVLEEFPVGYNEFEETVLESSPAVYDPTVLNACEPWQAATAGTLTMNSPPPISRIMSISIRNNTGGALTREEIKVSNSSGSLEITIPSLSMSAAQIDTFRCGAGSRNNSTMSTVMAIAQPAGIELAYSVYDAYQVMGKVSVAADILSASSNGTSLTVSSFTSASGDFDVTPTPTVGDTVQITYKKNLNNL